MIILANDRATEVTDMAGAAGDLWIRTDELAAATGWELKPEGACLGDLCVPMLGDERADLVRTRGDGAWLKYSGLADKVGQKYVTADGVWSLGAVPAVRRSTLEAGLAPDFEVTDRKGETLRLSDLRGKKVLVITWASW
jgi:hypothetical protein